MDLFQEARKGNEGAFLQLFDEHHLPLFRFAYRLTGSVSDAEDVVQECFLELLRPGCSYDAGRTRVRTYLFGVARNQCLKWRRKSALSAENGSEPRVDGSPESQMLHTELEDVVATAVME
jgi:RNA polymerase sigma-70 factor, ECF subfamily